MGKSLQELTIKDNFLFAAVMMEEENCKELLEMILKIKIAKIMVHMEKTIVYNPEYKGVRLDIEGAGIIYHNNLLTKWVSGYSMGSLNMRNTKRQEKNAMP